MHVDIHDKYTLEINSIFRENNIILEEFQKDRLASYASLIVEKNEAVNLISRKDTHSVIENHIFISAFIAHFLPEKCCKCFLDIGTGGGFPGIPLAITKPALKGVLVDSITKKILTVNEFINKLKLGNVIAENSRVESPEFIQKYQNQFDLVVSRATDSLSILLRYSLPLMKEKAYLAAMKGGDLSEEIKAAEIKYRAYIRKLTVFELAYKPSNLRNEKEKKLVLLELNK